MRLLYYICSITILIFSSSYSKNINIENINFEVPSSHIYIEYSNDEVNDFFQKLTNTAIVKMYLMGPKKYIDLEKFLLDGNDIMNNPYVKSIMDKMEKKSFRDGAQASKWIVAEVKNTMRREKIDFITYVVISDQNLKKTFSESGYSSIFDELTNMSLTELSDQSLEIRKMITSLSSDKKSIPLNETMTIKLNKFKISKKKEQLYLNSIGDLIFVMGPIRLDIDLNLYLTEHNNKAIMLLSACYVNCAKFNNKFNLMKKNSFNYK